MREWQCHCGTRSLNQNKGRLYTKFTTEWIRLANQMTMIDAVKLSAISEVNALMLI